MPNLKISEDKLLRSISEVFRNRGYEGTTITELTKATGLQKPSLYYRFPGGKEEMAVKIIEETGKDLILQIERIAQDRDLDVSDRRRQFREIIARFYRDGALPCLVDSMSLHGENTPHLAILKNGLQLLVSHLVAYEESNGSNRANAEAWANSALIKIQGALIVARVLQKPELFRQALNEL
jgi:AcrR family transcriptional regulator